VDDKTRTRLPSARPRRKPVATEPDQKLWKEALFEEIPISAQPEPDPESKPDALEELPPTVQAGEIVEEIIEVGEAGEGVERVPPPKKRGYRELLEWVLVFAAVAALVILALRYVAEPIHVDGHSMQDTLGPGEYVLVTKYEYLRENPLRFDVVSCKYPNQNKAFVKRVIGLPGETVELKDGELYINGQYIEQDFTLRKECDDYGPVTVPADHYVVMGDNRLVSVDSRDPDVGPLPRGKIEGHVRRVIFPLGAMRAIEDKHRVPRPEETE